MDLFRHAMTHHKQAEWARRLNVTEAAFSQAKKRGRLSPTLAGELAANIGEDPRDWITIAALEAEPDSPLKDDLIKRIARRVRS
ncbi:hypothetical protein [Variovorax saccharolyticus]|uniref:hypothetical protein n=1 Tax=Variovorax saccharolyticus TaxID=3053516 RepID=UPI0025768C1C|nr:hypothetical protein [Variovorax sp. J31P216]MDM0027778.1 hypothetical protein [Variovorax sp. J31P216]